MPTKAGFLSFTKGDQILVKENVKGNIYLVREPFFFFKQQKTEPGLYLNSNMWFFQNSRVC